MPVKTGVTAKQKAREFVLTCFFGAPRSLVFRAWTEREHLAEWSAPFGFTIPYSEGELRHGGRWRCCMRSPEGVEHWLGGVYREVIEPERLVFTHAWDDPDGNPGHQTLVTVTLEELGGRTKLTLHQTGFDSDFSRDGHREGWSETLDQLAELLAGLPPGQDQASGHSVDQRP